MKSSKVTVKRKEGLGANFKKFWPYYIMVIPGVLYLIVFKYIPLLGSIIAFQNYSVYKGIFESEFVGLKHFIDLLNYADFKRVFSNTLILGVLRLLFTFPLPIILSLFINEISGKYLKKSIQTAIYIPYFLSWAVVGGLVFDILGSGGIFNNIRGLLGMKSVLWMQKESSFRIIYVISSIWKDAGWGTVVYLAAISGIDPALYEAAAMDGATRFQRMTRVTFPLLVPTILTIFLLNIGSFLELGFDQVYNLMTPMTYSVADIFDTYVYRVGIQQAQYSFTTAVGLFQSVIGLILVVTFNKLANKASGGEGGLW